MSVRVIVLSFLLYDEIREFTAYKMFVEAFSSKATADGTSDLDIN